MVGIRDAWYGFTEKADDPMKLRRKFNLPKKFFGDGFQDLAYPIWNHPQSGILKTPSIHLFEGPVYVDDIFVKPSVTKKELAVEITLKNTSDTDQAVEINNNCRYKWFDPERASTPGVRSLFDDLQFLRDVVDGDSPFTPVEIDRVAVLLSYVNNRI